MSHLLTTYFLSRTSKNNSFCLRFCIPSQYAQVRLKHNAQSLRSLTAVHIFSSLAAIIYLCLNFIVLLIFVACRILVRTTVYGKRITTWIRSSPHSSFTYSKPCQKAKVIRTYLMRFLRIDLDCELLSSPADIWKELKVEVEVWSTFLGYVRYWSFVCLSHNRKFMIFFDSTAASLIRALQRRRST